MFSNNFSFRRILGRNLLFRQTNIGSNVHTSSIAASCYSPMPIVNDKQMLSHLFRRSERKEINDFRLHGYHIHILFASKLDYYMCDAHVKCVTFNLFYTFHYTIDACTPSWWNDLAKNVHISTLHIRQMRKQWNVKSNEIGNFQFCNHDRDGNGEWERSVPRHTLQSNSRILLAHANSSTQIVCRHKHTHRGGHGYTKNRCPPFLVRLHTFVTFCA